MSAFDFSDGEVVYKAGNTQGQIGFVFSGSVEAKQVNLVKGTSTVLGTLQIGDSFGEVAAVMGNAQSEQITSAGSSTVIFMPKKVVEQLSGKIPAFSFGLAKRMATKLTQRSVMQLSGDMPEETAEPMLTLQNDDDDRITFVKVAEYDPDVDTVRVLPTNLIQRYRLLPLMQQGNELVVGMVDPHNGAARAELERLLRGTNLKVVAISQDDFNDAFVRLRLNQAVASNAGRVEETTHRDIVYEQSDQEREADRAVRVIGDEVVRMASQILAKGIDSGASDIHIEDSGGEVKVRFRMSGSLVDWDHVVPSSFSKGLVARFKVLAGLDITDRRLPQDGRIGVQLRSGREVDFRISTMPASRGEKVVLRMFEASNMMRPLEKAIVEKRTLRHLRDSLARPWGAIVVAGPTGSGKSSTLYASLNERRKQRPDTNVIMVEDPIEYRLAGVTQVQVNHGAGLDFARILRAILRQDPDVIMVGEIRDGETAQLALEASMTGHLLFTSVHANNAAGVLQRLVHLGCDQTMVAQSLAMILVQRLVRRLCPSCKTEEAPPPILVESLAMHGLIEKAAPIPLPVGKGCARCGNTGFSGRVAALESLVVDEDVRAHLLSGASMSEVMETAEARGKLVPFKSYSSYLMQVGLISAGEALLTVSR